MIKSLNKDHKETYTMLYENGFEHDDIDFIVRLYKKEGIKFCKKSFYSKNYVKMKKELEIVRKEQDNETRKKDEIFYKTLFTISSKIDAAVAIKALMG